MSDYERIRRWCQSRGELWEDPDFPAMQSSVFYHQTPPFAFVWRRPRELSQKPLFVAPPNAAPENTSVSHSAADLSPGKMGDRWLVSCLGVLHSCKGLFYRAVPADQGFTSDQGYCGAFRFRLWWCGEWTEVVVDDRLPTVNGRLAFVHSPRTDQYWAALLEKAYAKLHGSYEALKYGTLLDGLADLTGGVAESLPMNPNTNAQASLEHIHRTSTVTVALRQLKKLISMTSVVTCSVQTKEQPQNGTSPRQQPPSNDRLPNGVHVGLNYRVMALLERSTEEPIIRLVDPLLGGEISMPAAEWTRTFTNLEVVHLDSETARDEPTLRGTKPWHTRMYSGRWRQGVTAGGCRNNVDTFHINPQLLVVIQNIGSEHVSNVDDPELEDADMVASLNQHSITEPKVVGFTTYKASSGSEQVQLNEQLGRQWFKKNRSVSNSQYTNSRQVSHRCHVTTGGQYVILPTTFEPGQECAFTLRVMCTRPIKLRALDTIPRCIKKANSNNNTNNRSQSPLTSDIPSTGQSSTFGQYEAVFLQLADEHRTINAFELHELLDACLPNDYIKSCATLEVCRRAVSACSSHGSLSGRLGLKEFRELMCGLKTWQGVFKAHAREKTGILKSIRLRDALIDVGYQLDSDTMALLVTRYVRKDGTLRFADFVSIVLHLQHAFNIFQQKDRERTGLVRFTISEWLRSSLAC